ncbi:MAG: hypothetical protein K2M31_01015 [Muribaculaceae bacterium]|nr:hypothetical protein [Muribaculaceae bacterium]
MNYRSILPLLLIPVIASIAGCKKYSGEKAAQERAQWIASLNDSISNISAQRKADSLRITQLRSDIDLWLKNFTQVNDPKQVEPYYIHSSFMGSYPLNSTGIASRIKDNQEFEIVAALSGSQFDAIRLTAGEYSISSPVVPPDQGLNFTSSDGLTVCSFSGKEITPIAEFVAVHEPEQIWMEYLRNGQVRSSIYLSHPQKRWISETWRMASARQLLDSLERRQMLTARKLELLHITLRRESE